MVEIRYKTWAFKGSGDDLLLLSPTSPPDIYEAWHPISQSLEWDTLTFGVKSEANGIKKLMTILNEWYTTVNDEGYVVDDGDLMEYSVGEPVQVYKDGAFWREFYIDTITRRRGGLYEFSCVSAVGLLAQQVHRGGLWFSATAGEIIADIMGAMPYNIDDDVSDLIMNGWLPYDTARNNLSRVLLATGASLMKTNAGQLWVTFNEPTRSTDVTSRTYYEMEEGEVERYGTIRVIEHTFFNSASQTEEVLYDNRNGIAVSGAVIRFEEPQAVLRGDGLNIDDSGANWAQISGTGVLYGKAYVHAKRVLEESTGLADSDELEIADNALIGRLNSPSVMERLVNYYSNATTYKLSIKHQSERTGGLIIYPTMTGDMVSGYIRSMDSRPSSFTKSDLEVVSNWKPTGLGNTYNDYFLLTTTSGGNVTIPAAHRGKKALAVLFGGSQGGSGGYDGTRGESAKYRYWDTDPERVTSTGYGGLGGDGGAGGSGGGCGRYLMVDIESLAASYPATLGAGGAGGARNGEEGQIGGDTILDGWTTADGIIPEGTYVNMIDGTIYGEQGPSGAAGASGGAGGNALEARADGEDGQSGSNFNNLWRGGRGGHGDHWTNGSGGRYWASGGGGGGAAYGASAADAGQAVDEHNPATAGANATAPAAASFYMGGSGGNGGGGGGGSSFFYADGRINIDNYGAGGHGSVGGQGARGFILVYV